MSHQSKLALEQSGFEDQQSGPRSVGVEMATGRGQWRMGKEEMIYWAKVVHKEGSWAVVLENGL